MERLTQNNFDYCLEMCEPETQLDCAFYMSQTECVCGEAAIYNKLREYENAEQEGRLVVLPCKVGTVVWSSELTEIDDDGVEHVAPWSFVPGMMDEWGKSFFLTRAEAEKALEVRGDA